jgi:hypothetical protein
MQMQLRCRTGERTHNIVNKFAFIKRPSSLEELRFAGSQKLHDTHTNTHKKFSSKKNLTENKAKCCGLSVEMKNKAQGLEKSSLDCGD